MVSEKSIYLLSMVKMFDIVIILMHTVQKKFMAVKTLVNGPYCRIDKNKIWRMGLGADLAKKETLANWWKQTLEL